MRGLWIGELLMADIGMVLTGRKVGHIRGVSGRTSMNPVNDRFLWIVHGLPKQGMCGQV